MKNILYSLLALSLIFSACKKEEEENNNPVNNVTGCMDSIAANFNPSAVEDDGSCDYRVTGGKWIQVSESYDLQIIAWLDEDKTQFIDSMSFTDYVSNTDSMSIQQLKFFVDGNVKTYDNQGLITNEGTWVEDQEGTINHTITITDDDESMYFEVENVSKEGLYLKIELNEFEYESSDNIWIEYIGDQFFSFERNENK